MKFFMFLEKPLEAKESEIQFLLKTPVVFIDYKICERLIRVFL